MTEAKGKGIFKREAKTGGRLSAKRLLIPLVFTLIFLVSLVIIVTMLSSNAQAAYGLQVQVQPPKDKYLETTTTPQSALWTVNVQNTGTSEENVNLTVTFNDPGKPLAGWTVNPTTYTVNSLGSGVTEQVAVQVTCPESAAAHSFAQLTVTGKVQEQPTITSQDTFVARVAPIYKVSVEVSGLNTKNASQGGSVSYSLIINNTGNIADTITLSATGLPTDWGAAFTPVSKNIVRNSSYSSTVQITLPSQVKSTLYPINIIVTSQGDPGKTDSTVIYVTVIPEYLLSVSVSPSNIQTDLPGNNVQYTMTVENLGNTDDRVQPGKVSLEGLTWITSLDKGQQNIAYQASKSWTLTVSIPDSAKDWDRGKVVFNATSIYNPSGFDQIETITEVGSVYGISVFVPINTKITDPGKVVSFQVQVENVGNTNDTITLSASGEYTTIPAPNKLTNLPPATPTYITLNISVPNDALSGLHYSTITALSENLITKNNATVTIDVNPKYEIDLQSLGGQYKSGKPGGTAIMYQIKVVNDGTGEDEVTLSKGGQKPNWASLSSTVVTIPAKSYVIVFFNVTIPSGEKINVWFINITGESTGNSSVKDTQAFQIEVEQTYKVQITTNDDSNSIPAGGTTKYFFSVKNTGSGEDDFTINAWAQTVAATTWTSVAPSGIHLKANQNITVMMEVQVPDGATPGNYLIWLNATSDNETTTKYSIKTITEVTHSYEVVIAGGNEQILEAPEKVNVTYSVEIYNFGTTIDSFQISLTGDKTGWATLSTNLINSLPAGQKYNLTVKVQIKDANDPVMADGVHSLKITVTSKDDPTIPKASDFVWLNTTLTATREASLNPQQDVVNAKPADTIQFIIQVTNTGSASDTFKLEDAGAYKAWGTILTPTVTLGPSQSVNITYRVDVHPDVTRGESPVKLYLLAKSVGANDAIVENITLTVNINQTYGVKISTTQNTLTGDPGQTMNFTIRIKNEGNDEDTFTLDDADPESAGTWDLSEVTLQPKETVDVIYRVKIDQDHDTTDIVIVLNATSDIDVSGLTFQTLTITVHVNPQYKVKLGQNGGDRKDGIAGRTTQFNLTVKNEGTAIDTFDIEVTYPSGFTVTLSDVAVQVKSVVEDPLNSTKVVNVYVDLREEPPVSVGQFYINITATSVNDETAVSKFTFIVNVKATRGVSLYSPTASVKQDAGKTAIFAGIQVTNKGNDVDSFSFYTIGLPVGWNLNPPPSNQNNVPADGTASFDLNINIPSQASSGIYTITLVARSVNDPSRENPINLTIEVNQIYGIQLPNSVSGKSVDIGKSATYLLLIKNTGNGADDIELKLTGEVATWTWLYYSPTENGTTIHVSPPAGGSLTVTLYVVPPSDYWDTAGDVSVGLTVEAESLVDPGINPATDTVAVTTTVNPVYGVDIISGGQTSGEPGVTVSFLFSVENTGTTTDSYSISIKSVTTTTTGDTSLWNPEITFSPTSISNLNKGLQTSVSMYVKIPNPADLYKVPPGRYTITIELTSSHDNKVKDTDIFLVDVSQVFWADVQNTVNTKSVNVGESVQFSITIKNKGNGIDNLSVELEGDADIPGSVNWGKLSHAGTGQTDLQSLSDIRLNAGASTTITLKITVPQRTDPQYPSIDPDDVTLRVVVKPSDEDGTDDQVAATADINVIYQYDFSFLAQTLDVNPGNPASFTIKIENKGTSSETFTYEIFQWEKDWSAYGYTFTPSTITISSSDIGEVTLSINTPSDLGEALSQDYDIKIKVHSNAGSVDIFKNCTIHLEPVYDVDLTVTGSTSKAVNVGNSVTYQFTVRNTGNANETFAFSISDLDTSTTGGGDQSSWVKLYLVSNPGTPITSLVLFPDQSKAMNMVITVPLQGDPNFAELTAPLQIKVEAQSEAEPAVIDSFTSSTTINPIYSFELTTTAPANTKEGKPGDQVPFTLQIRNTGTATDSYEFRVTSIDEAVFTVGTVNAINNLGVDSYGTTTATFTISLDKQYALEGSYQIEITADSTKDPAVTEVITIFIDITGDAEVELTPAIQSDSGEPGDVIDYTVKVSNKGNAQDIFDLTLSGQYKDWGRILSTNGTEISSVTLSATTLPGSFADVLVRVTIPGTGETNADQEYSITIKAASRITEDITDTAEVKTKVEQFVELDLDYSGSGAAAADYNPNKSPPKFSFKVTNNGNVPEDAISVAVDDMPSNWDFTPPTIDILEPGKSTTFSITFDIPADEDDDRDLQVYVTSSDGSFDSEPVYVRINITKPNLFIEDVTGLDNLDNLKSRVGNAVTVGVTVGNSGTAKAESIQVKFYEENNVRGTKTISSIDPGDSKDVSFRWTVVADDVELKVEVTPIIETDEGDNDFNLDILDLRPDLAFHGENINITTTTPGESATIKAFVRNTGGNAEDVVIKFYEGTKIIGTDTLDIDFDETGEASVSWDVPDKKGDTIEIRAEIDLSGALGDGDEATKSVKIGDDGGTSISNIFEGAGLLGMGIGLGIGFILFIIGLAIGRGSAGRRRGAEGAGPSFAAFEKEEGLGKGAAKGPAAAPAPFGAPPGEEGEAPPGEEEEAAKPKEAVRVRCPKCGKVKEVTSTQRPLQIPCECGTTLMLKK